MSLAQTAIFLGAGASCPFGFPDTAGLLRNALQGLTEENLFFAPAEPAINEEAEEREDMLFLKAILERLLPGWTKGIDPKHLPAITEVLSLVDYCLGESKPLLPGLSHEEVLRVRRLLERAIYEVLWDSRPSHPTPLFKTFVDWIENQITSGCGVITTNYDTYVEQRLFDNRELQETFRDFDFGFAWLDPNADSRLLQVRPEHPKLRWLKLHGSLNWARCPACEHIYINTYGDIAFQAFRRKTDASNTCHCGNHARLQIHLVAPSMYRTVRDANLLETWKNALQLLLEAKHWIFIGYSLPSEDIAIRSLLVRAYHSHAKRPQITVIQKGDDARPRYEMLFGKSTRFTYQSDGMEAWLKAQIP